ncbi:hypothetical protein NA57DRAFT_77201 [Rhizodiscina lignyota]|uniref:Monooxygenase n=1 Tax=Rhizodiscina lignyota TaxID=1504668 RepID=A0A9P4MA43_9PEZI|nr:hypothetical protein NA57DRAFT_77201 [Rhizodiscina lignyota]
MDFKPLIKPFSTRPDNQWLKGDRGQPLQPALVTMVRDQLTISSWLALGACLTFPLYTFLGPKAVIPAAVLLGWRILDSVLMTVGLKHNPRMDNVLNTKFAAQFPDQTGAWGNKAAHNGICVILLGARSNHPLGMLAPNFKEVSDRFDGMMYELEKNKSADDYGFLGATRYISMNERKTNNDIMTMMWFRNADGLRRFAHSPIHIDAWNWWNKIVKKHPFLTIWHEVYDVPPGHWEAIYANAEPIGIAATTSKVYSPESKEAQYMQSVVDARHSVLRTSFGRMDRTDGNDNDDLRGKIDLDVYGE